MNMEGYIKMRINLRETFIYGREHNPWRLRPLLIWCMKDRLSELDDTNTDSSRITL